MKSITVTTHSSYNYGGVLQAYALQKYQESLGIDNKLLQLPILRQRYSKIQTHSLKKFLLSIYSNINAFVYRKDGIELRRKFDDFVKEELKVTELFGTKERLYKNPPEADFYVSGSDQVFSVRNRQAYARMLEWVPDGKKKYSYAASLGEYDWSEEEKERFGAIVDSFDGISVREPYAKEIISPLTKRDVQTHLDPVFLLTPKDYDRISTKKTDIEPYILVYPLISNKGMQELIDKAKKELACKTISIRVSRNIKYKCDEYVYDAGPKEFLELLRGARAVITTSFHGTALSCLFNIPFYVMIKDFKSQRITDLLEHFNLSDRIYKTSSNLTFDVDFSKANKEIEMGRKDAMSYFEKIKVEVLNNHG